MKTQVYSGLTNTQYNWTITFMILSVLALMLLGWVGV